MRCVFFPDDGGAPCERAAVTGHDFCELHAPPAEHERGALNRVALGRVLYARSAVHEWAILAEQATKLSDDVRQALGDASIAGALSPDAQLYAAAVATLLGAFARSVQSDLKERRGL